MAAALHIHIIYHRISVYKHWIVEMKEKTLNELGHEKSTKDTQ